MSAGFIDTSQGWVNLDHVIRLWHGKEKETGESLVELADGRKLQCVIYGMTPLPTPTPGVAHRAAPVETVETDVGRRAQPARP